MISNIIFSLKFHFLNRDVLSLPSYGVYISQLFRFTRVCLNVIDFNNNKKNNFRPLSSYNWAMTIINFIKFLILSKDTQS